MLTKENLLEYAGAIGEKVDENDTFENIYEKVTGQSYNIYLKEQEEIKKSTQRVKYEQIPHRKLVLKKNNIKVIQGIFPKKVNKKHLILKCKKGKRIIILNIWVREKQNNVNYLKLPLHIKLIKDIEGNIFVYYSIEPPYDFEIEYFTIKNKLSIKHEPLYQLDEKTTKILTLKI